MAAIPVPAATIVPTDAENGICTGQRDGDFATTSDGAATFRVPPGSLQAATAWRPISTCLRQQSLRGGSPEPAAVDSARLPR
jgi:hypothetical protein